MEGTVLSAAFSAEGTALYLWGKTVALGETRAEISARKAGRLLSL